MNVGFYYHIEALFEDGRDVRVPAFLGEFIVELARQAGHVTYFAHRTKGDGIQDFVLPPELVHSVDLGPKRSALVRTLVPKPAISAFRAEASELDIMLIRGPSPLLPALARASKNRPLALLLVNDYLDNIWSLPQPLWRKTLIYLWARFNAWEQLQVAKRALVLVNSQELKQRFEGTVPNLAQVFTSSLSDSEIAASCRSEIHIPLRLLYAGRIDRTKGLFELVEALSILVNSEGYEVILQIAGWADEGDPTKKELTAFAENHGVGRRLDFVGYLKSGPELFTWLRSADLFILPSYAESFPRAILDALAAGLPVIASRVGDIPHRLHHQQTAYLIEPHSSRAIVEGVIQLVQEPKLRQHIAENGLNWVRQWTNEASCSIIVNHLRCWVDLSLNTVS